MITIRDKGERAELKIKKGTGLKTILIGTEMMIDVLLEAGISDNIDNLLNDLKTAYLRDKENNKNE